MGKIVSKVTDAVGLTDSQAAKDASAKSDAYMSQVLKRLDDVDVPDTEKMKLLLEHPELMGELEAEELDPSAMEEIALDPRLRDAQYASLEQLRDIAEEGGLSAEDRIRMDMARRQTAADEQARQDSILQGMAQRGALDSGAQLAAQLQSSQSSADRAGQESDRLALAAIQGKRGALQQAAQMASGMQQADFGRQAQQASASDVINRFNAAQRQNVAQQNLANKQRISEQQTAMRNQQQMYNKNLQQQDFENRMRKAGASGSVLQNMAGQAQQRATAQTQADSAATGGGMAAAAMMMSDKRMKDNISKPSSDELQGKIRDMIDKLEPYEYSYKEDPMQDEHTGIMAQDLEQSELGQEFVEETPTGDKMVDYGKMAPTQLAATADLQDRVSDLERLLTMLEARKR